MPNEIRIVIADDHPLVCQALRDALAKDATLRLIAEAADGQTALTLIEQLRPDVAIVDIRMPKLGGLGVARAVRQQQLPTHVIIVTGYEEPELLQAALKVGVTGYVRKDSAVADIVAGVKAVAAGKLFISTGATDESLNAPPPAGNHLLKNLTPAERRILRLIAAGKSSKEIAALMRINYRTVDNHRTNISHKLGLHGSHALLRFAVEHKDDLL